MRPGCCSGSVVCVRAVASRRAIGGVVSARRPSQTPITAATAHQPTLTSTAVGSKSREAEIRVSTASKVAAPALSRTVTLRKSTNRTPG